MTSLPLDELYLNWLYRQVADVEETEKSLTRWSLFRGLYTTEFLWLIPNDDNRVEDGKELRVEFVHQLGLRGVDHHWLELGCSFLEMLIALSRRLAFESVGSDVQWFWHLLKTLDLHDISDAIPYPAEHVVDVLDRVMWRRYQPDGSGGLFPLRFPTQDQRRVEIWYQLNAYLMEND